MNSSVQLSMTQRPRLSQQRRVYVQVLRFMDWMDTNSEYLPPWGERTKPEHDTQARPGGVALEYIVQLSNQLGAAPWVCVHHLADDAYVTKLASFLKDNLRPDLRIYVEHSK